MALIAWFTFFWRLEMLLFWNLLTKVFPEPSSSHWGRWLYLECFLEEGKVKQKSMLLKHEINHLNKHCCFYPKFCCGNKCNKMEFSPHIANKGDLDTMSTRIPDDSPTVASPTMICLLRWFTYDNLPTTSIRLCRISVFTEFVASLA